MSMWILLLEFGLLGFIAIFLYIAKRDLNAAAARRHSPAVQEMREVQETIEGLIAVLEQKAEEIEARLQRRFDELAHLEKSLPSELSPSVVQTAPPSEVPQLARKTELDSANGEPMHPETAAPLESQTVATSPIPLNKDENDLNPFEKALALIEQGNDARTVARLTGLAVAEVETAARMRQLRQQQQQIPVE